MVVADVIAEFNQALCCVCDPFARSTLFPPSTLKTLHSYLVLFLSSYPDVLYLLSSFLYVSSLFKGFLVLFAFSVHF